MAWNRSRRSDLPPATMALCCNVRIKRRTALYQLKVVFYARLSRTPHFSASSLGLKPVIETENRMSI
jgi:hypothetical protein